MPNPGVTTLATVRTQAAQRADMPTPSTSTYITTSEWNSYINASYYELYDLLVQKYGDDYFVAGTPDNWYQLTTDGTSTSYALPDGSGTYLLQDGVTTAPAFYKGLGVDIKQGSEWVTLRRFEWADRNRLARLGAQTIFGLRSNIHYRFNGNRLWLAPLPLAGQTVRLWYTPRLTPLVNDTDTLDGVSGWEEYIVVDAAIKALDKEESDSSSLRASKAALIARIEAAAENRDTGAPPRVSDQRRYDTFRDGALLGEEYF